MIRIDAHTHTEYSHDCKMSLQKLKQIYARKGIIPIITDHNRFLGAERFSRMARCIKGMEIKTMDGEIIGIFLEKPVRPWMPVEETIDIIHKQHGLVIVPHPFDRLRRSRLKEDLTVGLIDKIDIVEVFNSRTIFRDDNRKAEMFARQHRKPMIVGSDSHLPSETGRSYLEMEDFKTPLQFLKNLRTAKLIKRYSPLHVHIYTKALKILRGK